MKQLFLVIGLVLVSPDCWAGGFGISAPSSSLSEPKNECPYSGNYYVGTAQSAPLWTELTPDQVKKCMQLYWQEQVDKTTKLFTDQAKMVTDAYKHLGMWQQQ